MDKTKIKKTIGFGVMAIAMLIFAHTIYGSVFYAADNGSSNLGNATPTPILEIPTTVSSGVIGSKRVPPKSELPDRLIIPSLEINANVQYTGVNSKGNMGTPNNFTDVAWFKPGTVPGEEGSAVMAGHVDNGLALDGVFKHLEDIEVGDKIDVVRNDKVVLHFQVVRVTSYPYDQVPAEEIFGSKEGKFLNLITCVGDWVPGEKTYDRRLVVYSKLVE